MDVGALEAIRTGTTTFVENAGGIGRYAAALFEDRIAMGVRRIDPRQRERARSAFAGRAGEGRDAALLAEAARRGHAAHRQSVQRVARQEERPHQRVPGGGADRDVVSRTAESGARVCRETRSRLHDSPQSEHRRVSVHGEVPWTEAGGVSRQARLPRPAPVRRPCAIRRCRRDRAARQVADDHFAPGQHGGESRRDSADSGAARSRLPDRARHRQQHERRVRGDAHRAPDRAHPPHAIRFPACVRSRRTSSPTRPKAARAPSISRRRSARSKWARRRTCSCSTP